LSDNREVAKMWNICGTKGSNGGARAEAFFSVRSASMLGKTPVTRT